MRILVIDNDAELRETLVLRVTEAYRQAGLRRVHIEQTSLVHLGADLQKGPPELAFLGPGCYQNLEEAIERFRSIYPTPPLALVLSNDVYAATAVELRKHVAARIMPLADIVQMAQFLLDAEGLLPQTAGEKNGGVINLLHLKGGVGATSLAAALAACWARHDLSVALVDLDDVNPQLTEWAEVGKAARGLTGQLLRSGEVQAHHLDELLHPVQGFSEQLVVCGQPERYSESFHFKADVIAGAPSAADYIEALIPALRERYDVVILDSGRSWGISTFASLPYSEKVLFVCDDDPLSLKRSLSNFRRLYRESNDPAEFDLSKWSFVLNSHTGELLSPEETGMAIAELELFPDSIELFTVPFAEEIADLGQAGATLYEHAGPEVEEVIRQVAFRLVPFRYEAREEDLVGKLRRGLKNLVGA